MSKRLASGIFYCLAAAFYAAPVLANSAEENNKEGLPQFDTALFPEQLFWLAVTFAVLYVLMAYVALPLVGRTQDRRASTISGDLAAAQAANEEAKSTMANYEKALADARAKAQATVGELAAAMAKEFAARQAAQQQELNKKLVEAEARITAARDAAVKDVKGKVSELAKAITDKVAGASHAA